MARKTPAAVFYGLVITAIVGIVAGLCGIEGMPAMPDVYKRQIKRYF